MSDPTRSPAELVVKLLTVHIVTTANYAYLCHLQGRPLTGVRGLTRIIFFIFVPTLCYLEALLHLTLALMQFWRDGIDNEEIDFWFHLSAAFGVCAAQRTLDPDESKNHEAKRVPLLSLSHSKCSRQKASFVWSRVGHSIVSMLSLAQGIGTIIVWVQRFDILEGFEVDSRNGAMGIATVVISVQCLFILAMGYKWTVDQPISLADNAYNSSTWDWFRHYNRTALVALFTLYLIRIDSWYSVEVTPVLLLYNLGDRGHEIISWPLILLGIFIIVMRREIFERLGFTLVSKAQSERSIARGRAYTRVSNLVHVCLMLFVVADIIIRLVQEILQVCRIPPQDGRGTQLWLQTPLSAAVPVL